MKTSFRKYILAVALTASAGNMMAQELNSAYFTDDFKYRHDMNAAYGNEQNSVAIPVLGNFNVKLQGSFGVGDVLFKNPYYGNPQYPNAKKTATFMHPGISSEDALKGEAIRAIFDRFYGIHSDTKTDFIIHIDPMKNKYQLALYRYGLREPQIIAEEAYQLIVFKNKFEYFRSENYDQPRGAWIW